MVAGGRQNKKKYSETKKNDYIFNLFFQILKISPYKNFEKFFGMILAPTSGRRRGQLPPIPPRYATV